MIDVISTPGVERSLADLVLVPCVAPRKTCAESSVLLARVRPIGTFELLTAAAWARALGYAAYEFRGKSLRELMQMDKLAAGKVVAALLDEKDPQPLEIALLCKDKQRKYYRLYRRYDAYEKAMFVVAVELAEELSGIRREALDACG